MLKLLNRALNINREEWPRLAYLGSFIFAFVLGINWAQIVILAAFTAQVGPELVPYLFIGDAIAVTLAIIVYSAFVDRYSHERVMLWMIGLGLFGIIVGIIILQFGEIRIGYIYFYILFRINFDVLSVHAGTYRSTFFDTQSAKRAYPVLFSILRVAVIVAGFSIPLLNSFLKTESIIIMWAATMLVMALLVMNRARWIKTLPGSSDAKAEKRASYWENTREGFKFVKDSPYLRVMALASFAATVTLTLITFQTLNIFRYNMGNATGQIANYTGTLTGIGGLIILPIQLFIFSRFVAKIGVGNASLIFPIIVLIVTGIIITFPLQLFSGGLAYFNNNTIKIAIYGIVNELLYNAVPLKVRGRSRAFVNGVVTPFGTLIGGVIVLLPITNTAWFLPVVLGGFSAVMALSAVMLRANYAKALVQMLEQEDFGMFSKESSRFLETANSVNLADKETVNFLTKRIYESTDTSEILLTAQLLVEATGRDAVPLLENRVRSGSADVRAGLLTVFAENDIRSDLVQKLSAAALEDPDPQVQRAAITGLEHSRALANPEYLKIVMQILPSAQSDVQMQVIPFLLNDPKYKPEAEAMIQRLLASDHPEDRVAGVQLLGKSSGASQVSALLGYLIDPIDIVRLAVLNTLDSVMTISQRNANIQQIGKQVRDVSERVRLTAIRILKNIDAPEAIPPLLSGLDDSINLVRREATQALISKGKAAVQPVRVLLTAPAPQQRQAATFILSSIQRDEYRNLLLGRIDEILTEIYRNIARLHSASELIKDSLFADVINERNQVLKADLFQMLGTLYDAEGIEVIRTALSAESTTGRANAAEALEAIVSPKIGKLIAQLLNPSAWVNDLILAGQLELGIESYNPKKAIESFLKERNDYWLRAVTAFMLGEIGAGLNPNKPAPSAEMNAKTERHRRGSFLLDALTEESKSEDNKKQDKPPEGEKTQQSRKTPTNRPSISNLANLLSNPVSGLAGGTGKSPNAADTLPAGLFTLEEIRRLLKNIAIDPVEDVRTAADAASRIIEKKDLLQLLREEGHVLSAIEKIIFLRGVPFFQNMTVNQLKVLAAVCEERNFRENKVIIEEGDQTGVLYVVVRGRVGVEKLNKATRTSARLSTLEARSYFGEDTLFDNSPSPTSALAVEDTLTLVLRHEPLVALMQDNPELSLQLIKVLSQRLRETSEQVAGLTRNMSRSMHQVYDKLG